MPSHFLKRNVFAIKMLIKRDKGNATNAGITSIAMQHLFCFASSIHCHSIGESTEVIGSGQMTLARNLNRIAFIAAFAFLAAIVVGII